MTEGVVLEKFSKSKQGRPRKHSKEFLNILSNNLPSIKTERGLIESKYLYHAAAVITKLYTKNPESNRWAEFYADKNHVHIFHKSILAALGRIEEDDVLISVAKDVAVNKLSAIQAISSIRRFRLDKPDQPNRVQFLLYLERSINSFLQMHPSTHTDMIAKCLFEYAEVLEVSD
jgi:hypothetical protein